MTLDEYQQAAMRTVVEGSDLVNAALGLCGEAGEFADIIKKVRYHGHDFDRVAAAKELGDILWYLSLAAERLGYGLDAVAALNLAKLQARYPLGFSSEASRERAK